MLMPHWWPSVRFSKTFLALASLSLHARTDDFGILPVRREKRFENYSTATKSLLRRNSSSNRLGQQGADRKTINAYIFTRADIFFTMLKTVLSVRLYF